MKTTATNKKVRELMGELTAGRLITRPDFQRKLVWTQKNKQAFIATVLEGYPFPEIFLCDGDVDLDSGAASQLVVDGQQRVTTLYQYFKDSPDFEIGGITPYGKLGDQEKKQFLNYEVVVRDLGSLADSEVREVFYRMNSTSYQLNAIEVNNARFAGELKLLADWLAEESFFEKHRVFNAVDIRRMRDVSWCLTFLITLLSGYFTRDTQHEIYLKRYNDELPEFDSLKRRSEECVEIIDMFDLGADSRAWKKADLFTLMVEVDRSSLKVGNSEEVQKASERLAQFYDAVDGCGKSPSSGESAAANYYADVNNGSNERARRVRRGQILERVLAGCEI